MNYIIPSDNWEQQPYLRNVGAYIIISYQAITGNNNVAGMGEESRGIISYQAITGNNNPN